MSIHYGDCLREAVRGQKLSKKFTSGLHVSFKNYVSAMEAYISGSVNTFDGWAELSKCSIRTVCLDWKQLAAHRPVHLLTIRFVNLKTPLYPRLAQGKYWDEVLVALMRLW